jgi:hypothetical protein
MSLESFLSAFKQLILENELLPEKLEDRRCYYKIKFPLLNDLEVEDLAKLQPNQIRIYTGTIFRGELVVLERRLPLTFKAIKREWGESGNSNKFDPFCMLVEAQKKFPWKSHATKDLVQSFIKYLLNYVEETPELYWMVDLARLEASIAEVKRSSILHYNSAIDINTVEKLLVQDILKLKLRMQHDIQFFTSKFDLNQIRHSLKNDLMQGLPAATENENHYLISRNSKLFPRVTLITAQEKMAMQNLAQLESSTELESFIETSLTPSYLDRALSNEENEELETLFLAAFQRIIALEKIGAIVIEHAH